MSLPVDFCTNLQYNKKFNVVFKYMYLNSVLVIVSIWSQKAVLVHPEAKSEVSLLTQYN